MDVPGLYLMTRTRLLELAPTLDAGQAASPVPALPGWTVKDAYAHLTGLSADVVEGRMDGMGTPAWTAKHVADRADRSLAEVVAEWAVRGAALDEALRNAGRSASPFVVFDVWSHEQDIRGALGRAGVRDEHVHEIAATAAVAFSGRFTEAGVPALRIEGDGGTRVLGTGEPAATLHIDDYELLRVIFARRSQTQIEGADWDGDAGPYVEHLHLFELPVAALVD
jgi:uncharacterized protein (TIGR03083 family)